MTDYDQQFGDDPVDVPPETVPESNDDVETGDVVFVRAPMGRVFEHKIDGLKPEIIGHDGAYVPSDMVDALVEASAPFGAGYLTVETQG